MYCEIEAEKRCTQNVNINLQIIDVHASMKMDWWEIFEQDPRILLLITVEPP